MKEKKSETLSRLWPEYFGKEPTEKDILKKCLEVLENITYRYNIECNSFITRKQIIEIDNLTTVIQAGRHEA